MRRTTPVLGTISTLAALAFAAPLAAQDITGDPPEGGWTVVEGNTLWDLAERFLGDPFQWRTIWEANRETIPNPDLIYPGQTIRIPGADGSMIEVRVVPAGQQPPARTPMAEAPPARERTIFYPRDESRDAQDAADAARARYVAVSQQASWRAPFLLERATVEMVGRVDGFAGADGLRSNQTTAQPFDRISVATEERLPVGARYLTVRRELREGLGEVVVPTALVTITRTSTGSSVALVEVAFDRATVGDQLIPLPEYREMPGVVPAEVVDGRRVTVLGYLRDSTLHGPGDILFLDAGADAGLKVGDEFTVVFDASGLETDGVAQVVRVDETGASARIVHMRNAVFRPHVELVQSRAMPNSQ